MCVFLCFTGLQLISFVKFYWVFVLKIFKIFYKLTYIIFSVLYVLRRSCHESTFSTGTYVHLSIYWSMYLRISSDWIRGWRSSVCFTNIMSVLFHFLVFLHIVFSYFIFRLCFFFFIRIICFKRRVFYLF